MGCALGQMAVGITLQGKKLDESKKPALRLTLERLGVIKNELRDCASEDARAFDLFMKVRRVPKDDPARPSRMQDALRYAAQVPLKTAGFCSQGIKELQDCKDISAGVASDRECAGHLLRSGIKCAAENVRINLDSIKDKDCASKMEKELESLTAVA